MAVAGCVGKERPKRAQITRPGKAVLPAPAIMSVEEFKKKQRRKESPIVTACCQYLRAKQYFFWRQNNVGIYDAKIEAFRANPNNLPGVPDIFLLHRRRDDVEWTFYAIEVKTLVGKQSAAQIEFQKKWEMAGGVYLVARAIDDLIKAGL